LFTYRYWVIVLDFAMNQRSYRLRSSSAGPRPSGPAETERLAEAVMLDHHKESMPGREMRVEIASGDTAVTPWGLSSSPHFNTTIQQSNTSLTSLSQLATLY